MRVLWFTNIVLPDLARALGRTPEVTGGWMSSLLEALRGVDDVEVAVATLAPGRQFVGRHDTGGVSYFCLPGPVSSGKALLPAFTSACDEVVRLFKPDVIHVHGTENPYGLYTGLPLADCPAVVSIQGLLHLCARHVGGDLRLSEAADVGLQGVMSWARFRLMERSWSIRGQVEKAIIRHNRNFIGRTAWDRAHVASLNPSANYFHCDESLRAAFFSARWSAESRVRRTVFCSGAHLPLKGLHLVIDAVGILHARYPDIEVRVAAAPFDSHRGQGYYGRYLWALMRKKSLQGRFTALPALNEVEVAFELSRANAFVMPSLVDNSPNSLAEAMLVGTPCVAAMAGGIPSLINDGVTALGVPVGDASCLADCLQRIFDSDSLAETLSSAAREVARKRHESATVCAAHLDVYRQVIRASPNTNQDGVQC